jgi:hypothetical protein
MPHMPTCKNVQNAVQVALLGAVVLGFGMAEVGISIQHDANHGAFCR